MVSQDSPAPRRRPPRSRPASCRRHPRRSAASLFTQTPLTPRLRKRGGRSFSTWTNAAVIGVHGFSSILACLLRLLLLASSLLLLSSRSVSSVTQPSAPRPDAPGIQTAAQQRSYQLQNQPTRLGFTVGKSPPGENQQGTDEGVSGKVRWLPLERTQTIISGGTSGWGTMASPHSAFLSRRL